MKIYLSSNICCVSRIAKQQEKIDLLSSKLSKYQVENETLKAENATLIDELVSTTSKEKTAARISISSKKVPLDTKEKLKNEIATLQVLDKVTKKSFQTFIKDNQRSRRQDKQTITKLQQENDALLLKLMSNPTKLSSCEGTAKTSLASFIDTIEVCQEDSSLYPSQDLDMFLELEVDSLELSHSLKSTNKGAPYTHHSMPRNNRNSTVKADVTGVPRSKSANLLVDFGETSQPYRCTSNRQRHSIGY